MTTMFSDHSLSLVYLPMSPPSLVDILGGVEHRFLGDFVLSLFGYVAAHRSVFKIDSGQPLNLEIMICI